jgi:hypothetical protein
MSRSLGTLVLVGAVVIAGCGDDGGGTAIDAPEIDAPVIDGAVIVDAPIDGPVALDAATGQIWIRGSGISGATNRVVLAFVTPAAGGPPSGGVCVPVTSDPMSFVAAVRTQDPGNPCTLGGEVVFADGAYDVTAGIYTPGMQTPDLCANTSVVVAGSGDVTLPAFAACP